MSFVRRALSDRRKVLAAVILLTIIAIAGVEYVTVRAMRGQLLDRVDASLARDVEGARVAVERLDPEALVELSSAGGFDYGDTLVFVMNADDEIVWQAAGQADDAEIAALRSSTGGWRSALGEALDATGTEGSSYRAMAGDLGRGLTIVFATPLADVEATVSDVTRAAVVIGVVVVGVLGVVLWRVLAAARKPVDAMIGVATRIGSGDFTARIDSDVLYGDAARLGNALNSMVSRIDRAFEEKTASEEHLRRFVADASHELRTPLTSIRGYAQLCRKGAAGEDADAALARIDDEARRMALLVDDLLLLARLDQGRPLRRDAVDMAATVRDVVAQAKFVDPRRRITVTSPDSQVVVDGDEDRLRQVVRNLVDNVRAHAGDAACHISVDVDAADVVVTVSDDGPGMTPHDAAKAFVRFYRADASRTRDSGGSGLGLSIVQAITTAHGGTIELTSGPGAGTSVRVRLPRTERLVVADARGLSARGTEATEPETVRHDEHAR